LNWVSLRDVLRLRAQALQATVLAAAQADTLRIKLLKVAAVVMRNTRRVRLCLVCTLTSKRPATRVGAGVLAPNRRRRPLKVWAVPANRTLQGVSSFSVQ
jgi:hypothetical protein